MAEFKTGWMKKAGEKVFAWSHAKTCYYDKGKNITIFEKLSDLDDKDAEKVDKNGGDIANTKVSSFTASTVSYPVPVAGETPKVAFGKIKKFFEDIRNAATGACFIGQLVNNCVTNNAKLPLSAAQGKVLMDLYNVLNTNCGMVLRIFH